ncbi:MAG: CAP domain-containing protein [Chloroflexota bacterium]|nr:CAP domain-containing protein [Chloroflexota bacterium]
MKLLVIAGLVVFLSLMLSQSPVSAQVGSASDLINAVNKLRQSQGLAPYTVDSFLMGFAQTQSDYMASLGAWTHTRADGTTAFDYGIKENVAMGTNMSVTYCINSAWSDAVHWETMMGYATGKVGAGVTVSDGNVYYTLNVLPGESTYIENIEDENSTETTNSSVSQYENVRYIQQVITSTPNEDGIITHVVQYGETLWTIAEAYGVPIDQILRNSGLGQSTTEVFEDQELIIQTATEPTPTVSPTPTEIPPTPTPTQPRPTMTPFPTRTPAPTPTSTKPPSIFHRTLSDGKSLGIGLIILCGAGLLFVVYQGFIKKA